MLWFAYEITALGKEDVVNKIIITEDAYTTSYEWGVKTTAKVLPSFCRQCLDEPTPLEECWDRGTCLDVNKD